MLDVSHLSYGYVASFSTTPKEALRDVSFTVREGEAFGFLGHNGAGKTTTIKCILGLIRRHSGEIRINGVDSKLPEARACLGYVPEQPYFYDHLTVAEALNMYARLAGVASHSVEQKITWAMERLGIADRRASRMRSLSKGLTQRVAMAQAITAGPSLLILDEPFSGLDPVGRREFRELILELKEKGTTILMSSHVLSDVERICDRASILVRGKLEGVFDLHNLPELSSASFELVLNPKGQELGQIQTLATEIRIESDATRLRFDCKQASQAALAKSLELGLDVISYSSQRGSLEDLFTHLVTTSRE
jgi:ABC-2 type transport system ATP-binding protein